MNIERPEYRRIAPNSVFAEVHEGRCGRAEVCLGEGHTVLADYWATPHRLEIRVGDLRLVRGATSWCKAIQWGHEYQKEQEALRAAIEVVQHFQRKGKDDMP